MLALSDAYCPWIRTAGSALRPKPWAFPNRVLADYLLIYVEDGHEWIRVNDEHHEIGPGAVYLIQPGRLSDKGSHNWSHPHWIHFDLLFNPQREQVPGAPIQQASLAPELAAHVQPDTLAVYDYDFPLLMPQALLPRFHQDIPQIISLWRSPHSSNRLAAVDRLQSLLHLVLAHGQEQERLSDSEAQIQHAEQIARASLASDFGVRAFAAAAGLSPSRFHDVYKQLRGQTPLQFLTAARMELARRLLRDQTLPISSIAALVGHPDPTVFGRIFRREHGMTPRAFRNAH